MATKLPTISTQWEIVNGLFMGIFMEETVDKT